jgi:hypothetical protein
MGLLDLLLNRKNLTFDWAADPRLPLVVDLDQHSLCGVPVGDRILRLSGLGPCDEPRRQTHLFAYKQRGFYITEDEGELDAFGIHVSAVSDDDEYAPFAGKWRYRGRDVALTPDTSPEALAALLGEPFHTYQDPDFDDERIWFYEHPKAEWQFTFDQAGRLQMLEVNAFQEMQSGRLRRMYNCTKPWPFGAGIE